MDEDYKKNSLFKYGYKFYAHVYTPDSELTRADGFKEAARTLLNRIDPSYEIKEENDTYTRNTLVYPIVYNYRHYLELRLKEVMEALSFNVNRTFLKYMGKKINDIFRKNHKLIPIWNKIIELSENLSEEDYDFIFGSADLKKIETRINELSSIDPRAIAFKYPREQDGSSSIPLELQGFDVKNFIIKMDEISEMLEAISNNLAISNDLLNEYLMSI